ADATLAAVGVELVAHPSRMALRTDQRDVRRVDRHVAIDDAALHRGPGRLLVLLGDVHAVDDHLVLVGQDAGDVAFLAAVLAGEHAYAVALLDSESAHHNTSGASETMRMNRLSRSSRPTGPKMRVPRGCC